MLNAGLAEELDAHVGEDVGVARLGKANQVPADSPLGRKTDRIQSIPALKVTAIVPATSLGRFSLQPMQTSPHNAYVSLRTLQEGLEVTTKVNAIVVAGKAAEALPSAKAHAELTASLQPRLEDYGLGLEETRAADLVEGCRGIVFDYFSLTSDRMMLDEASQREAMHSPSWPSRLSQC